MLYKRRVVISPSCEEFQKDLGDKCWAVLFSRLPRGGNFLGSFCRRLLLVLHGQA